MTKQFYKKLILFFLQVCIVIVPAQKIKNANTIFVDGDCRRYNEYTASASAGTGSKHERSLINQHEK
jgi:hypothetical protein